MIALIQRVTRADVVIAGETVAAIGAGILALIGVEKEDSDQNAERLLARMLSYRIFPDDTGRMNRSVSDISGGLLLVPQFTLAADTHKGTRPSFSSAAAPEIAQARFLDFVERARAAHPSVQCGRFGADMAVTLVNDGPVTFWLDA